MRADLDKTDARSPHAGPGSERSFGLVFAAFFAVMAVLRAWRGLEWEWFAAVAVLMIVLALTVPAVLAPFNRLWYRFGMLLSLIFQPIVLGLLFFVTVTPIALIMRLTGKNPLRLRFAKDLDSYWIVRDPSGSSGSSLNRQF
jgi:Saxitoxin biosynthesis operon protein SxtJ